MRKIPRKRGCNVVPMPVKPLENRTPARDIQANAAGSLAGSPDDPRTQEAMRLVEAFLAIEDAEGRSALITLAERLVSHDWVRNVLRR